MSAIIFLRPQSCSSAVRGSVFAVSPSHAKAGSIRMSSLPGFTTLPSASFSGSVTLYSTCSKNGFRCVCASSPASISRTRSA